MQESTDAADNDAGLPEAPKIDEINELSEREASQLPINASNTNNASEQQSQTEEQRQRLKRSIQSLNRRCDEFNDIKQYIRQMNDVIKDELLFNMGAVVVLLRHKVDSFSNVIKDKLKCSYNQIKDKHSNLVAELNAISAQIDAAHPQSLSTFETRISHIQQELKSPHPLYPQFEYIVLKRDLIDAIEALNLEVLDKEDQELTAQKFVEIVGSMVCVEKEALFECIVTSGLSDQGRFWVQITNKKQANLLIDEISKIVRLRRISDESMRSLDELTTEPFTGQKCFCLEMKSRKWLRARVEAFSNTERSCRIRYLDTGVMEAGVTLDRLLSWHQFDLNCTAFQAVQCSVVDPLVYAQKFTLDAKFLFKDLTVGKHFKCMLNDRVCRVKGSNEDDNENIWDVEDDECWSATLYNLGDYMRLIDSSQEGSNDFNQLVTINQVIMEHNDKELNQTQRIYASEDIRLKDKTKSPTDSMSLNKISIHSTLSINTELTSENTDADCLADNSSRSDHIQVKSSTSNVVNDASLKIDFNEIMNSKVGDAAELFDENLNEMHIGGNIRGRFHSQLHDQLDNSESQENLSSHHDNIDSEKIVLPLPIQLQLPLEIESQYHQKSESQSQMEYHHDEETIDTDGEQPLVQTVRKGECFVSSELSENGLFWIRPYLPMDLSSQYNSLSQHIFNFIHQTRFKSYAQLHIMPQVNRKCFVALPTNNNNPYSNAYYSNNRNQQSQLKNELYEYARGVIEHVNEANETCRIRLLDKGNMCERQFYGIYPHRRLREIKLPYRAVPCLITTNEQFKASERAIRRFKELTYPGVSKYELVESMRPVHGIMCWYAEIETPTRRSLNKIIVDCSHFHNNSNYKSNSSTNSNSFNSANASNGRQLSASASYSHYNEIKRMQREYMGDALLDDINEAKMDRSAPATLTFKESFPKSLYDDNLVNLGESRSTHSINSHLNVEKSLLASIVDKVVERHEAEYGLNPHNLNCNEDKYQMNKNQREREQSIRHEPDAENALNEILNRNNGDYHYYDNNMMIEKENRRNKRKDAKDTQTKNRRNRRRSKSVDSHLQFNTGNRQNDSQAATLTDLNNNIRNEAKSYYSNSNSNIKEYEYDKGIGRYSRDKKGKEILSSSNIDEIKKNLIGGKNRCASPTIHLNASQSNIARPSNHSTSSTGDNNNINNKSLPVEVHIVPIQIPDEPQKSVIRSVERLNDDKSKQHNFVSHLPRPVHHQSHHQSQQIHQTEQLHESFQSPNHSPRPNKSNKYGFNRQQQQNLNNANSCKTEASSTINSRYNRDDDNDDPSNSNNKSYGQRGKSNKQNSHRGSNNNRGANNNRYGNKGGSSGNQRLLEPLQQKVNLLNYLNKLTTNNSYVVACGDDEEQSSSAYNEVFIDEVKNEEKSENLIDEDDEDCDDEIEAIENNFRLATINEDYADEPDVIKDDDSNTDMDRDTNEDNDEESDDDDDGDDGMDARARLVVRRATEPNEDASSFANYMNHFNRVNQHQHHQFEHRYDVESEHVVTRSVDAAHLTNNKVKLRNTSENRELAYEIIADCSALDHLNNNTMKTNILIVEKQIEISVNKQKENENKEQQHHQHHSLQNDNKDGDRQDQRDRDEQDEESEEYMFEEKEVIVRQQRVHRESVHKHEQHRETDWNENYEDNDDERKSDKANLEDTLLDMSEALFDDIALEHHHNHQHHKRATGSATTPKSFDIDTSEHFINDHLSNYDRLNINTQASNQFKDSFNKDLHLNDNHLNINKKKKEDEPKESFVTILKPIEIHMKRAPGDARDKQNKPKQFSMAIFVESFEDYSYGKNSSDAANTTTVSTRHQSPMKIINNNHSNMMSSNNSINVNKALNDSYLTDDGFKHVCDCTFGCNLECALDYRNSRNDDQIRGHVKVMNELIQVCEYALYKQLMSDPLNDEQLEQTQQQQQQQQQQLNTSNEINSLQEFEFYEYHTMHVNNESDQKDSMSTLFMNEEFMYDSSHRYTNWPIAPSNGTQCEFDEHNLEFNANSHSNGTMPDAYLHPYLGQNNCLSTITECSNENIDSLSHQSINNPNHKVAMHRPRSNESNSNHPMNPIRENYESGEFGKKGDVDEEPWTVSRSRVSDMDQCDRTRNESTSSINKSLSNIPIAVAPLIPSQAKIDIHRISKKGATLIESKLLNEVLASYEDKEMTTDSSSGKVTVLRYTDNNNNSINNNLHKQLYQQQQQQHLHSLLFNPINFNNRQINSENDNNRSEDEEVIQKKKTLEAYKKQLPNLRRYESIDINFDKMNAYDSLMNNNQTFNDTMTPPPPLPMPIASYTNNTHGNNSKLDVTQQSDDLSFPPPPPPSTFYTPILNSSISSSNQQLPPPLNLTPTLTETPTVSSKITQNINYLQPLTITTNTTHEFNIEPVKEEKNTNTTSTSTKIPPPTPHRKPFNLSLPNDAAKTHLSGANECLDSVNKHQYKSNIGIKDTKMMCEKSLITPTTNLNNTGSTRNFFEAYLRSYKESLRKPNDHTKANASDNCGLDDAAAAATSLGNFSLYGLDTNENDEDEKRQQQTTFINSNKSHLFDNNDDKNENRNSLLNKIESEISISLSQLPPPPLEFQNKSNVSDKASLRANSESSLSDSKQTLTSPSITSSSSVNLTPIDATDNLNKLNNFNKNINQEPYEYIQSCPEFSTNLNTDRKTITERNVVTDKMYYKPVNNNINLNQIEPQLRLDHLSNVLPMRLVKGTQFNCRIHDVIEEDGSLWLECIYSDNDETKYEEMFKLFRLFSKIGKPCDVLEVGKFVSAMYKEQWYRAVVVSLIDYEFFNKRQHLCKLVRVHFVDLGITRTLDRAIEIREIDEKFFRCPFKSVHCSIRLNEAILFSREMRKCFTRLTYKKKMLAEVESIDGNKKPCKIILGVKFPRGFVNVYWYLLSKFNRNEYEKIKRNVDRIRYANLRYIDQSSDSIQSTTKTNDKMHNALHHTDLYRLDTLNEVSIESFNSIKTSTSTGDQQNDDERISSSASLNSFRENYENKITNHGDTKTNTFIHRIYFNKHGGADQIIKYNYVSEVRKSNDYVIHPVKMYHNFNDLDDTPVKESYQQTDSFDTEREILQKRFESLNIKPLEIDNNEFNYDPGMYLNNTTDTINTQIKKNDVSCSDTDSSVKGKCCTNLLKMKWMKSNPCITKTSGNNDSQNRNLNVQKPNGENNSHIENVASKFKKVKFLF